jgi:hypothetical protein
MIQNTIIASVFVSLVLLTSIPYSWLQSQGAAERAAAGAAEVSKHNYTQSKRCIL